MPKPAQRLLYACVKLRYPAPDVRDTLVPFAEVFFATLCAKLEETPEWQLNEVAAQHTRELCRLAARWLSAVFEGRRADSAAFAAYRYDMQEKRRHLAARLRAMYRLGGGGAYNPLVLD